MPAMSSCTLKQIDLQVFLLLQLPYCVSVLLLTSRCKSHLHNTNAIITIWQVIFKAEIFAGEPKFKFRRIKISKLQIFKNLVLQLFIIMD